MGRRPKARGRDVHGILLLNKPAGLTSNDCLQRVKRLFNANRAGHTGSLDKPATGMLPLCLGEATKLSSYLLDSDKEYIAIIRFGKTTTTGDAAGDILIERPIKDFQQADILAVLNQFKGDISQVPPMYSAIKHQGKRLYQLAYNNQEVERKSRTVSIYKIELIELYSDGIKINVSCSKGTYIRTLAVDIGEELGCGAHIESLHRTKVGIFTADEMVDLADLEASEISTVEQLDQYLILMDRAVEHLPAVHLERDTAHYLLQGQAVTVPKAPTSGMVRLYDEESQFIGIGHILDDGRVAPKRLFSQKDK